MDWNKVNDFLLETLRYFFNVLNKQNLLASGSIYKPICFQVLQKFENEQELTWN